ncbi:DUF3570 domain-containing protein [Pseudozobellia thermophila]|uniref:DUF3570 domain-containing protein n=1 Tax=Pseudozobellia thermophila TaxID=192903 RepID=A0A1M6IT19_9FLAO|nr:DUF3570 domain-containing protein [Pseudozobellia thermophila]SHJ37620.1 Protein of unknown function [Pseudozobellia thermophila]
MAQIKSSLVFTAILLCALRVCAQEATPDYKQRVLESSEIDFLTSYYSQDGGNAAVTGGRGTEELSDATATIIVSIPLNDDDVLTVDAGISAYTSASSSNVNPFDGNAQGDPFNATTGASRSDTWVNFTGSYSHSSDDRNDIWSARLSVSSEYDYFSFGFGGSYAKLFNEKNTEVNLSTTIYLDKWKLIYPIELRPFMENGIGEFRSSEITGNTDYSPNFTELEKSNRNSYAIGIGLSQILGKTLQGLVSLDVIRQQGLLSTPFQRVYFSDIQDSFVENFQLADDIERLPDTRSKLALGGRLNWFVSPSVTLRSYYRYYFDDWGIASHTASVELPIKLSDRFTLYPSYRLYHQTEADYFAGHEAHLSSEEFYTSDHDLSEYMAHQYGIGISYTDIFTKIRISNLGLKSIDLKFYNYDRDTEFSSIIATGGFKFVFD